MSHDRAALQIKNLPSTHFCLCRMSMWDKNCVLSLCSIPGRSSCLTKSYRTMLAQPP
jgi:hypothetical protein